MRVLVTGATGFVGRGLIQRILSDGFHSPIGTTRQSPIDFPVGIETIQIDEIGQDLDWSDSLVGSEIIIHLAARVHVMNDPSSDPLTLFRTANVQGTLNLARQAVSAGVKRFILVSSIKVNGESTLPGKPFQAEDLPAPKDPYGISKMEAEEGLKRLATETGMEVVIIRPPLVYGPGVKANFLNMMRWVNRSIPLPLGSIHNKRSLVALDNLVDLIVTCIDHPAAANQTFLAGDGEDLSTTELLGRLGQAMGKPARLIPVPVHLLKLGAMIIGKQEIATRLFGNLQVDISKAHEVLGWKPPITVDQGLERTVKGFLCETN